jgi:CubicO group peptidase (beta-lactamase class C family)
MSNATSRRAFLLQSGRTAFGLSLFTFVSCSDRKAVSESTGNVDGLAGLARELERQIPSLLRAKQVPGLSMALIHGGRVVWSRGFGVMNAGSAIPVTADTLFEAGSMSKPVFAYAVMKLCETNVLDLNTPLTRYISERWIENDPRIDLISARHVLSHTSGFQNWRSEAEPLRIHFAPGTQHLYSRFCTTDSECVNRISMPT